MRKQAVFVLGAGGHGKVIIDALLAAGGVDIRGVLDDDSSKVGGDVLGFPVLGTTMELVDFGWKHKVTKVVLAIGDNYVRHKKFEQAKRAGFSIMGLTHPSACVSRFVTRGAGVVILAGAVVNPGSTIEDNVCVNTSASVDHDNLLLANCHIFPNATLAGAVTVGQFTYIGSGAVIIPSCVVGNYAYVGAGAVVVRDVEDGVKVAGVPARKIGVQPMRPA